MKKKLFLVPMISGLVFVMVGCQSGKDNTTTPTEETRTIVTPTTTAPVKELNYVENNVNIYREKDVVDKTIKLRFYEQTPTIPYISVKEFYKEFFKTDLTLDKVNNLYKYKNEYGGEIKLETEEDLLAIYDISKFSVHADFKESTAKTFLKTEGETVTPVHQRVIALSDYHIDAHGDDEA